MSTQTDLEAMRDELELLGSMIRAERATPTQANQECTEEQLERCYALRDRLSLTQPKEGLGHMSDKIKTIREALERYAKLKWPKTTDGAPCRDELIAEAALSALDQLAPTAEIVMAGDAMAVQLRRLAEEYRSAMSSRGGSSDIHPSHAEALTAWFATKSQPPLDIPEAIKAFRFIKEIGERKSLHNHDITYHKQQMVKWANHGIASLTQPAK